MRRVRAVPQFERRVARRHLPPERLAHCGRPVAPLLHALVRVAAHRGGKPLGRWAGEVVEEGGAPLAARLEAVVAQLGRRAAAVPHGRPRPLLLAPGVRRAMREVSTRALLAAHEGALRRLFHRYEAEGALSLDGWTQLVAAAQGERMRALGRCHVVAALVGATLRPAAAPTAGGDAASPEAHPVMTDALGFAEFKEALARLALYAAAAEPPGAFEATLRAFVGDLLAAEAGLD